MKTLLTRIEDALAHTSSLSEAIAEIWKDSDFFINNPKEGQRLVDILYFVECWSGGVFDYVPKEKIHSKEWEKLKKTLQEYCSSYDLDNWVGFELPAIVLGQMNNRPTEVQLCCLYTGLENMWQYVYADRRTYKLLEDIASLSSIDYKYTEYIFERILA